MTLHAFFCKKCGIFWRVLCKKLPRTRKEMPDKTPYYQATSRSATMSIAIIRSTIANCTVDPAATYWDHKLHLLQKRFGRVDEFAGEFSYEIAIRDV